MNLALHPRADDFGATPGANEAIIDAIDCGTVCNVGLLAVGKYLDHCLDALIERSTSVSLGLHAAIYCEAPELGFQPMLEADRIPSLLVDGHRFPRGPQEAHADPIAEEVLAELSAQLQKLKEKGLRISYLDTHMGFEWLPGVEAGLRAFCREHSLYCVPSAKHPRVQWPEDFDRPRHSAHRVADAISDQATGSPKPVWILHPAYSDALSKRAYGDQESARRNSEARLLIDPDFSARIEDIGLQFARFPEPSENSNVS